MSSPLSGNLDVDLQLALFFGLEAETPHLAPRPDSAVHPLLSSSMVEMMRTTATEMSPPRSTSSAHASADIFFRLYTSSPLVDKASLEECQSARVLCEPSCELTMGQVKAVIPHEQLSCPHYTWDHTPACRQGIVQLVQEWDKHPFNAAAPEICTILTWIDSSLTRGFLDNVAAKHKTCFYLERTGPHSYVLLSLDSVGAQTARRFIQTIRQDLSDADEEIILQGWTSTPIRQKSLYGCGAFSLDYLLRCHKTPHLLQAFLELPHTEYSALDWQVTYPPEFMVSTQSFTTLVDYIERIAQTYPTTHERVSALYRAVQAHTILSPSEKSPQNKYIEAQNEKFHRLAGSTSSRNS